MGLAGTEFLARLGTGGGGATALGGLDAPLWGATGIEPLRGAGGNASWVLGVLVLESAV